MQERIVVEGVPYVRADLWPVEVGDGVHVSGITFGLSDCLAAIVTAIDRGGNIFAKLQLAPHHEAQIGEGWRGTYLYDHTGMHAFGYHRSVECPRRPYR